MFELIRDAAGTDDLVCLHSLGIARHLRKDYAEADFVLIGSHGIFCLEVKGGDIERKDGLWRVGRGAKSYTSSEGPFKQAQSARWGLIGYLDRRLGRAVRKECLVGWGVVFPDIRFDRADPEWDQEVVYDVRDTVRSFADYAERLADYFRGRADETGRTAPARLSAARRDEFVNLLRGDFEAIRSLPGLLTESERELVALSADQHRVLDYALNENNPRLLCDGPAGSGKTLIALEAARRLAAKGRSVLLLCYNDNLAQYLKVDVAQTAPGVRMATLHGFFAETIKAAGLGDRLRGRDVAASADTFDKLYPELFESACSNLCDEGALPQFDVVIIDEAQDILTFPFLNCLDLVLAGGFRGGRWLIFHDSGPQSALYGRVEPRLLEALYGFGAVGVELRENFRNPKEVALEASKIGGVPEPICRRTLRSPVEYRRAADAKDQAKRLRALLLELIKDGVLPASVSILSWVKTSASSVVQFPPDVGKPLKPIDDRGPGDDQSFTYGTIAGFKGLENDIVILTDLPDRLDDPIIQAAIYVGMTRARTKLYAFVGDAFLEARAER
ncbi:DNA/RNA helicase domain-containing protein [Sphingomonas canadensis]|uniref:DNA 3'-5' helicase II n=1 Tax=Sphingomonas canadensis TaxID=1219257 RepID=A0ABW3H2W3_9SPHN|nr:NERD domain-containing protein/DEAD/DEAH box helicase [Sphingomonas canadensis]MCW3835049.1 NERD domain-containing protein/DEAD/DEAH box helicase [Sphingomonas canadensis]